MSQLQESLRRAHQEEKERDEKEENIFLRSKLTDDSIYRQLKTQVCLCVVVRWFY